MPLKIGTSKKTLGENFAKEKAAGKSEDQAWAIAYETQRRSRRKKKRRKK